MLSWSSWLLTVTAVSAVLTTTGWVAVVRFAALQRLLAFGLRRAFRIICAPAEGRNSSYRVTSDQSGVLIEGFELGSRISSLAGNDLFIFSALRVEHCHIQLPTLHQPLSIQLAGVCAELVQRQLPEPVALETRQDQEARASFNLKQDKLKAIDKLLWDTDFVDTGIARQQTTSGLLGRIKARALHRLLALCLQYVQLNVSNLEAIYRQADQPGPRPDAGHYLRAVDEICLAIRKANVTPEGPPAVTDTAQLDAQKDASQDSFSITDDSKGMRDTMSSRADNTGASSSGIASEAEPSAGIRDESLPEPDNSPPPMGPTITISISIRALVPDWDAAAVAVAMRMVDRLQVYEQYVTYWQARPQEPVHVNPRTWWLHAGQAAARECRKVSRHKVSLHTLESRHRNRLAYTKLYEAIISERPSYQAFTSSLISGRVTRLQRNQLAAMEAQLTLEEIAHFRVAIAAQHSKCIKDDPAVLSHAFHAVDAIISNLGALPSSVESMLFQTKSSSEAPKMIGFKLHATCPKIGVSIQACTSWWALSGLRPTADFSAVEASVKDISVSITPSGRISGRIKSFAAGGLGMGEASSEVVATLINSPSGDCNRLLQVADLHAAASQAGGLQDYLAQIPKQFLVVSIAMKAAKLEETDVEADAQAAPVMSTGATVAAADNFHAVRPPGFEIKARLAGIQVLYNKDVVSAVLTFMRHLDQLKRQPVITPVGAPDKPRPHAMDLLEVDPSQPSNLFERTMHAFATQNIPISQPLALPVLSISLTCPGIVLRIPYLHVPAYFSDKLIDPSTGHAARPEHYELIAAITRLRAHTFGEDFHQFMEEGTSQRVCAVCYLDIFCYQPPDKRSRHGFPGRTSAAGNWIGSMQLNREPSHFPMGPAAVRPAAEGEHDALDEQAISVMAKAWAHPDDYELLKVTNKRGSPEPLTGRRSAAHTRPGMGHSPALSLESNALPLIPLVKVAAAQVELSQKVDSLPVAPGSLTISSAVSTVGIHFWLSPLQVAHALSIVTAVEAAIPPEVAAMNQQQNLQPNAAKPAAYGSSAMKTQLRLSASVEIPLIAVLCLAEKASPTVPNASVSPSPLQRTGTGRPEAGGRLLPIYGINLVALCGAVRYYGTGETDAGLNVGGILVRDLQIRSDARFGHFLQTLPTRTIVIGSYANAYRRRLLRYSNITPLKKRWRRAIRTVMLRNRTSVYSGQSQAQRRRIRRSPHPPLHVPDSLLQRQVVGPQIRLTFQVQAATKLPGHPLYKLPPPAQLNIDAGNILLFVRISKNNRMLPFSSQTLNLVNNFMENRPPGSSLITGKTDPGAEDADKAGPSDYMAPITPPAVAADPAEQKSQGLEVHVTLTELDVTMMVEKRELTSLKLIKCGVDVAIASIPPLAGRQAVEVHGRVDDLILRDLQAMPEHRAVIQGKDADESCSVFLEYLQPHNQDDMASLIVKLENPRIILLFRFLYDLLHGVDIILTVFKNTRSKQEAKPHAGDAPQEPLIAVPLELIVHVVHAALLLPASSKSRHALGLDIDYLALSMPGEALPDEGLATANLPMIVEMVDQALEGSVLLRKPVPHPDGPGEGEHAQDDSQGGAAIPQSQMRLMPPSHSTQEAPSQQASPGTRALDTFRQLVSPRLPFVPQGGRGPGSGPRSQGGVLFLDEPVLPTMTSQQRRAGTLQVPTEPEQAASPQINPLVPPSTVPHVPLDTGHADMVQGLLPDRSAPAENRYAPEAAIGLLAANVAMYRGKLAPSRSSRADHSHVPVSVERLIWPLQEYKIIDRQPFVQPGNYGLVIFERQQESEAPPYLHIHIASPKFVSNMNQSNYAALLGFTQGNLAEVSSYQSAQPKQQNDKPQRTTFNPAFKFGAPAADFPNLRVTADVKEATAVMEAQASIWQSGAFRNVTPSATGTLPFFRAAITDIQMDLAIFERSGATYMQFDGSSIQADDLRLAYSKVMTDAVEEDKGYTPGGTLSEGELGMYEPPFARDDPYETENLLKLSRAPPSFTAKPTPRLRMLRQQASDQPQMGSALPGAPGTSQSKEAAELGVTSVVEMGSPEDIHVTDAGVIPLVHLVAGPCKAIPSESAHLDRNAARPPRCLQASVGLLTDGTIAVEVQLAELLLQWPFLSDLSFMDAASSIFQPPTEIAEETGDPLHTAAAAAAAQVQQKGALQPWLYLNIIAVNSQFLLPVFDMVTIGDCVQKNFGGGAERLNMHERMADVILEAVSNALEGKGTAVSLENKALALTWSAVRFAYAMGGDGQADMRIDIRRIAAFVRDPAACVTCLLLPLSCSAHLQISTPQVIERAEQEKLTRATKLIQRWWRRRRWQQSAERSRRSRPAGERPKLTESDVAMDFAARLGRPILRVPDQEQVSMFDTLVESVASPRTRKLLQEYQHLAKASSTTSGNPAAGHPGMSRSPSVISLTAALGDLTVRAAFSHIPLAQSALWMVDNIMMKAAPGNMMTGTTASTVELPKPQDADFRPTSVDVNGTAQAVSLVLCNDKPTTFGAPDVLDFCADNLKLSFTLDQSFSDRPPNQAATLELHIMASFLNNSSSRWEAICESWGVKAEMVDNISPIYRSDQQRRFWLSSKEHLNVNFNPASLLSFGDLLAFVNSVLSVVPNVPSVGLTPSNSGASINTLVRQGKWTAPEAAPAMREQLAVEDEITSRVPQKYLIQNQSGMRIFYWAERNEDGPQRTHSLDSGQSQTLKVSPTQKVLSLISYGKGGASEKVGNVINLHFEGNWMPLKDVAVSVVGKYRYTMMSPAEHDRVPIIVDIILVGRTKIITLHSSLWLENHTDRAVSFRLHVPLTPLTAPTHPANSTQDPTGNIIIGPFPSGSGTYLPVTAVLGGLLYAKPEGYREAQRDVIRLSSDLRELQKQQGYATCEPEDGTQSADNSPLHCSFLVVPAQVNSEFQAYKHIECMEPGELMRASSPLEAIIGMHPTLILTNALPYDIQVTVWQVQPFRAMRKSQSAAEERHSSLKEVARYDVRHMRAAFSGSLPIVNDSDIDPTQSTFLEDTTHQGHHRHSKSRPSGSQGSQMRWSNGMGAPHNLKTNLNRASIMPRQTTARGRHITIEIKAGSTQDVYVNMDGNLLIHMVVPKLGLSAVEWAVVSWASSQVSRETLGDRKYIYRLPKEIKLKQQRAAKSARLWSPALYVKPLRALGHRLNPKGPHMDFSSDESGSDTTHMYDASSPGTPTIRRSRAETPLSPLGRQTQTQEGVVDMAAANQGPAAALTGDHSSASSRNAARRPEYLKTASATTTSSAAAPEVLTGDHRSEASRNADRALRARRQGTLELSPVQGPQQSSMPRPSANGVLALATPKLGGTPHMGSEQSSRQSQPGVLQAGAMQQNGIPLQMEIEPAVPPSAVRAPNGSTMQQVGAPHQGLMGFAAHETRLQPGPPRFVQHQQVQGRPVQPVAPMIEPSLLSTVSTDPGEAYVQSRVPAALHDSQVLYTNPLQDVPPSPATSYSGSPVPFKPLGITEPRPGRIGDALPAPLQPTQPPSMAHVAPALMQPDAGVGAFRRGSLTADPPVDQLALIQAEEINVDPAGQAGVGMRSQAGQPVQAGQMSSPGAAAGEGVALPRKLTTGRRAMLRRAFEEWREQSTATATQSFYHGKRRRKHASSPNIMYVGIDNSMVNESGRSPLCRVTLFAPFWLDNRTGMDLLFQDHKSAPPNPLFLGANSPFDYAEVESPGVRLTDSRTPGGSHSSPWDVSLPREIHVRPILLNKQEKTRFSLKTVARREFSHSIQISTVGIKGSIRIKGPENIHPGSIPAGLRKSLRMAFTPPGQSPSTSSPALDRFHMGLSPPRELAAPSDHSITPGLAHAEPSEAQMEAEDDKDFRRPSQDPRSKHKVIDFKLRTLRRKSSRMDRHSELYQRAEGSAANRVEGSRGRIRRSSSISETVVAVDIQPADPALTAARPALAAATHGPGGDSNEPKPIRQSSRGSASGRGSGIDEVDLRDVSRHNLDQNANLKDMALKTSKQKAKTGWEKVKPVRKRGHRLFEFAVEVAAGPATSFLRHTKVITVKAKYVVDNQTGMPIEIKQRGTPDLPPDFIGDDDQCARRLAINDRAAIHWDDADLPHELVVRPLSKTSETWQWSGSFNLGQRQEYFGLRVRKTEDPTQAINIPVNITVGTSGSVLVTFKSRLSVPPYRIENQCEDVKIFFAQTSVAQLHERKFWNTLDPMPGGNAMPYAWDEPTQDHKLTVQAVCIDKVGQKRTAVYQLDRPGAQVPLLLPTVNAGNQTGEGSSAFSHVQSLSKEKNVPKDVKQKLSSLLAAEFSKKVYVTVYADGPTRVLRFADQQSVASLEAQESVLDLKARLAQVETELKDINLDFTRLHGVSGVRQLDLYGQSQALQSSPDPAPPELPRRVSKTMPDSARSKLSKKQEGTSFQRVNSQRTIFGEPVAMGGDAAAAEVETQNLGVSFRGEGTLRRAGSSAAALSGKQPSRLGSLTTSPKRRRTGSQTEPPVAGTLPRPDSQRSLATEDAAGPSRGTTADQDKPLQPQGSGPAIKLNLGGPAGSMFSVKEEGNERKAAREQLELSSSQQVQGSKLLQDAVENDLALLLGGDLIVTIEKAEDLHGAERSTHSFARLRIGKQTQQQTNVIWSSCNPVWEEALSFREVSAASELVVDLLDLGGSRQGKQLEKLAKDPHRVMANSRFLGRVQVPLSETLSQRRAEQQWYTLTRSNAHDRVTGRLRMGFSWEITVRSLLTLKLSIMERVLAQRVEILCMLHPVQPQKALDWLSLTEPPVTHQGNVEHPSPNLHSQADAGLAAKGQPRHEDESAMARRLLQAHMSKEHHNHLMVTVLEVRGLHPRKGVVVAFSANELPNPTVELHVPQQPMHSVTMEHTLKPRYSDEVSATYERLPSDTQMTVRVLDHKGKYREALLGETVMSCSHVHGDQPVYVWLPILPPVHRNYIPLKKPKTPGKPAVAPSLQVHLRFQWVKQVTRGQTLHMDLHLKGLGISVMGGLQDELFNLTVEQVKVKGERSKLEAKLEGSIRRLQLDNQMLDATQPVVLAPTSVAHSRSGTAQAALGDADLITFGMSRSFANNMVALVTDTAVSPQPRAPAVKGADGMNPIEGSGAILSFKDLSLTIGEMDFQADDGFLEALSSFILSIPTADIWQDQAWRQQQAKLLSAQFGPKEVESLAMNTVLPIPGINEAQVDPLQWVQEKELRELQVMRDQSSFSAWYFIEHAEIGDLNINCTIALTSSILTSPYGAQTPTPEPRSGLFSRAIGTAGFQLINAIGEAHKVLGGAGPAIAAVPLTVVWAGGSAVTLLSSLGTGKVGPFGAVQRVGFTLSMAFAQVISGFSRMGAAVLATVPPERTGFFSDRAMLNRAVQRPPNAFEAFQRAGTELLTGVGAATGGILLDPIRGYGMGGTPIAIVGAVKGVAGAPVRGTVGVLESVSKSAHGVGLIFLGREAISGSVQRRIRAPGAFSHDDSLEDFQSKAAALAQQQALCYAWQNALPNIYPSLAGQRVDGVVEVSERAVMLLTDSHVAMLKTSSSGAHLSYKPKWAIRITNIQTVRGHEDSMSYTLEYLKRVNLKVLGKWSIPSRKTIKCGSRDIYERFIRSINRHIRDAGHQHSRQTDAGLDLGNVSALTILDAPYETEEEQQQSGMLNDTGCQ
ncbi:hypothetical protein WJX84_006946 [Apatococcus fuscideae]|uniref:C2 domain-containing protein n=1 Tax=Apatococcus fuscideae TaxID=2026836 RepID=A0AAW1TF24_9CHLO